MTFFDPDHSVEEARAITIGCSIRHRVLFVAHCQREDGTRIISARRETSADNMKKTSAGKRNNDDLRPEYDLSALGPRVRGKYYRQAVAGSNLSLIEPELARIFPDSESVNRVWPPAGGVRALSECIARAGQPMGARRKAPAGRVVGATEPGR